MKRIRLIFIYLILASSILNGCNNIVKVHNDEWAINTYELLNKSKSNNGGYSVFIDEIPTSYYDTYYNIKLLIEYNEEIPNVYKLKVSLEEISKQEVKINDFTSLDNLHYQIMLFNMMNIRVSEDYKNSVKNELFKLKDNDGLFKFKDTNLQMNLIVTDEATDILSMLEIKDNYSKLNETINNFYNDGSLFNLSDNYKWTILDISNNIKRRISNSTLGDSRDVTMLEKMINDDLNSSLNKDFKSSTDLINCIALFNLAKNLHVEVNVPSRFLNYINSLMLKQGGFSIIGSNIPDPKFTFEMISFYPNNSKPNISNFLDTIKENQKSNGLFISKKSNKASISKSYMAFNVYKDIGYDVPNSLVNYFKAIKVDNLSPADKHYCNTVYNKLTLPEVEEKGGLEKLKVAEPNDIFIIMNYYKQKLLTENQLSDIKEELKKFKHSDGGYGFGSESNLEDTYYILTLLDMLGEQDKSESFKTWIVNKINIISDDSKKLDLEDIFYILNIMNIIKMYPQNFQNIDKYIENFKVNTGGYSFSLNGSAMLLSTFYGCECKGLLKSLQQYQ